MRRAARSHRAGVSSPACAARATRPTGTEEVLLDVTDDGQIGAAAERIGELDALVNNAGIAIAMPLEFIPLDELRRQLEVNVVGQVAVTQAFLPQLRRVARADRLRRLDRRAAARCRSSAPTRRRSTHSRRSRTRCASSCARSGSASRSSSPARSGRRSGEVGRARRRARERRASRSWASSTASGSPRSGASPPSAARRARRSRQSSTRSRTRSHGAAADAKARRPRCEDPLGHRAVARPAARFGVRTAACCAKRRIRWTG